MKMSVYEAGFGFYLWFDLFSSEEGRRHKHSTSVTSRPKDSWDETLSQPAATSTTKDA